MLYTYGDLAHNDQNIFLHILWVCTSKFNLSFTTYVTRITKVLKKWHNDCQNTTKSFMYKTLTCQMDFWTLFYFSKVLLWRSFYVDFTFNLFLFSLEVERWFKFGAISKSCLKILLGSLRFGKCSFVNDGLFSWQRPMWMAFGIIP